MSEDGRVCHQLSSLPTKHTFSGDRVLLVDNLSVNDIPTLYAAARGRCEDASETRQPFGEDEFLDEDLFRDFLRHAYVIVLRDAEQKVLVSEFVNSITFMTKLFTKTIYWKLCVTRRFCAHTILSTGAVIVGL